MLFLIVILIVHVTVYSLNTPTQNMLNQYFDPRPNGTAATKKAHTNTTIYFWKRILISILLSVTRITLPDCHTIKRHSHLNEVTLFSLFGGYESKINNCRYM